jgi:hypothetical protein
MTQTTPSTVNSTLTPSFALPIAFIFTGIPILAWQIYVGIALVVFGLFLFFQALTIRLQFTDRALDVYRSNTLIRHFPYEDWQSWRIFWRPLPILFYFKEVQSIHFLPMLFNPQELESALTKHLPQLGEEAKAGKT